MAEGGGLIALDEEMAGPGKAVRYNGPRQSVNRMVKDEGADHHGKARDSSNGMKKTIAGVAVLGKVESKELFVTGKCLL